MFRPIRGHEHRFLYAAQLTSQWATLIPSSAVSTSLGAVVGGQMYNNIPTGWNALIWCVSRCT